MGFEDLLLFTNAIINSIKPDNRKYFLLYMFPFSDLFSMSVSDDTLTTLRAILPEKVLIAALDLIDRGNGIQRLYPICAPHLLSDSLVIHYVTPWGHSEYEVLGSTATYTVLLDVPLAPIPYSCACPAFIYSVLTSRTHIMVCAWLPACSILAFILL